MKMADDASIHWYETLLQSGESTNDDNGDTLDENRNPDNESELWLPVTRLAQPHDYSSANCCEFSSTPPSYAKGVKFHGPGSRRSRTPWVEMHLLLTQKGTGWHAQRLCDGRVVPNSN
jgi:hypothetical protein